MRKEYENVAGIQTLSVSHHSHCAPDGPTNGPLNIAEFIHPFAKLAVYFGTVALGGVEAIETETFTSGRKFLEEEHISPADNQPTLQEFITGLSGVWRGRIGDQQVLVYKPEMNSQTQTYLLQSVVGINAHNLPSVAMDMIKRLVGS